jgi:hypothetical protein
LKSPSNSQLTTLTSQLLPYAVFVLLALVSWNRWIEPYVDSGRELMVPWRLAHGERLYRDVQFPHGPLGPYLAAASEAAFGRSLAARIALAAAVSLAALEAMRRLSLRMLSPGRAALAVSTAVAAAFFLRPGGWLFPFSLDAAIAVASLTWALELSLAGRSGLAGACVAASLLARPEMGAAGAVVLVVGARSRLRDAWRLAAAPAAVAAAGYLLVSAGIPPAKLAADGWLVVLRPPAAFRAVYAAYAGLDRIPFRVTELALAAVILLVIGAFVVVSAVLATRAGAGRWTAAASVAAVLAAAAAIRLSPPAELAATLDLFPPLVRVVPPVVVAAAIVRLALVAAGRRPGGPLSRVPDEVLWMSALFAVRLLLAAGYAGPYNAFFLPLPIVVALAGAFGVADRVSARAGAPLPLALASALAVFAAFRVARTAQDYRGREWRRVATGAGALRLPEPVASATAAALADLERRVPPGGTLTGFPEAGFYNYALGRRSPLDVEQFFPGRLDAEGERRIAARLAAAPPDALLYANVLAVGEGARVFGADYNRELDGAVRARFGRAAIYGPGARDGARIGDPDFFVEIRVPDKAR